MDLGEKLFTLQEIIYASASNELQKAGVPPTLGDLVMKGVYSKFQENAYQAVLLQKLQQEGEMEKQPEGEPHTGEPEELLKQLKEGV